MCPSSNPTGPHQLIRPFLEKEDFTDAHVYDYYDQNNKTTTRAKENAINTLQIKSNPKCSKIQQILITYK